MTVSRPQVLVVGGKVVYARDTFFDKVGKIADIIETDSAPAEIPAFIKENCPNLKAIYHKWTPGVLGDDFFSALPKSCKAMAHFGAGYDEVDVRSAAKYGIAVSHTPGAVDDATATTACYLILGACRQFSKAEKSLRDGNWKRGLPLAHNPEKLVLGVVGLGGIGKVVARRMAGWDMKIIYHNRKPSADAESSWEYKSSLDDLLAEADVVSVHAPLNANTANMFSKDQFAKMKKGSVFVNTGRGGLVDEAALVEALDSGHLYGAGLDVFAEEPKVNPEFIRMNNVTLLPHMGTETEESRDQMGQIVINNILDALEDKPLRTLVPEQRS